MPIFFLPALFALLFDLRRAARELLVMEARGFAVEVIPVQMQTEAPPAEAGSPNKLLNR